MKNQLLAATVRLARLEDTASIAMLTELSGYSATIDQISSRLKKIIKDPHQSTYIAGVDREIAGWIHIRPHAYLEIDAVAEVGGLVAAENHRSQEKGKLLMRQAETWNSQQGYSMIYVHLNANRENSHPFYQALGFEWFKTSYSFIKNIHDPN
ncbi:MAG: GNAT family N-acetyltransferase [Anaerolineales bacterium]|nr:GNAT family N-acetyltransferase [Anaerolineales bacterium]